MSEHLNEMVSLAKMALKNAYAPYSSFSVSACVRSAEGGLFVGCNVENASYSLTLCAESGAISAMVAAGHKKIEEIVIVAAAAKLCPPCGACRNRLYEFASGKLPIHLYNLAGDHKTYSIETLYPHPFGSLNLGK